MAFEPIFDGFSKKPRSQYFRSGGLGGHNMLRDQLSIPVWLKLGALIQGLFNFFPYRNLFLVAPVALVILYKIATALLQTFGILYANDHGEYEKPGDAEVCAIKFAARSNHPLGMFGSGFKEVGERFDVMTKELDKNATEFGYLGSSNWINSSDRLTSNEQMVMMYIKSLHHCHEYAHGKTHTETMLWWQQNAHKMKHVGTMHEIYAASKHSSEGI